MPGGGGGGTNSVESLYKADARFGSLVIPSCED